MICKIDNHSVYYEEIGSGKPILCIHGFPEDHRTMIGCVEPIMESFDHYRRIYTVSYTHLRAHETVLVQR